jgi:hypothetical protein
MCKPLHQTTHARKDVIWAVTTFKLQFFEGIKREIKDMDKKVKWKRKQIPKEKMEGKFKEWIYDRRFSQTRDTKIAKLIELY